MLRGGLILLAGFGWADAISAQEPPEEIRELIEAGNVEFEFYDPAVEPQRYPGRANFNYQVGFRYRLNFQPQFRGGERRLVIDVEYQNVSRRLKHTVRLPKHLNTSARWRHPLMLHELDHVAISTDPRARMLIEHLIRRLDRLDYRLKPGEAATGETAQQAINAELKRRREAVTALVNYNYQLLDKHTAHGVKPIANRPAVFAWFYTKANLDKAGFEYTGDVLDLLKNKEYTEAERVWLEY